MCDLLEGKDSLKASTKTAVGHIIAVPDFPFTKSTGRDPSGFPIYNTEKVWDDIHLCEVMMGKGPVYEDGKFKEIDMYVTAGDYALVTSGIADTICEAAKKSMEVVKQIEIPSAMIVRDDVGERLCEELPKLQKLGYCTDFRYD
jgi:phosphoribosylamine-glycine ligase